MKPARLSFVFFVVLLALVASISRANEDTKSNPYESIAARNPFQLKDPPPPPDPNDLAKPPPPPLATVEVTGVMDMRAIGKKKALLEIVPGPGKPSEKKTLEEGDRVDNVEVLFIDVDNSEVKINNGGTITNIALKSPTKTPAGPVGPIVQPGFPPPVLAPHTSAGYVPPTINPATGLPNSPQYNNNNSRGNVMVVGGAPAQATPTSAGGVIAKPTYPTGSPVIGGAQYGAPNYNAGSGVNVSGGSGVNVTGGGDLRPIPSRVVRTQSTVTPDQARPDPAQQYINMAIQKQQMEAKGRPMPPLPPIPGFDPNQ